ncbi:MAG: hypothetical protein GX075_03840 [Firmicutes bacterium]|nr:hypothetical protein [Bacillota bacterium]
MTLVRTAEFTSLYYTNSDRLKTDGKYAFAYDNAGNMIQKGNTFVISGDTVTFTETSGEGVEYWEYKYDLLNRLVEVKKNESKVAEYQYDPEGFRVVAKKYLNDTTLKEKRHYVFQGTEPIFEKNKTTGKVKSFVYALGKHLARVDGKIGDTEAKKYWYVTDHVGSIRAVTDDKGVKVWSADYLAFGKQFAKNTDTDFEELHSFTGKEYDPDTGLHYYNARWYDADLGRFISEDPVADPNNPNLYSYTANNPLRWIDPTGLYFSDDWAAQDAADAENTSYFTESELAAMGYGGNSGDSDSGGSEGSGEMASDKQTEKDSLKDTTTPNKTVIDDDLSLYQIVQVLIQEETKKLENEARKLEDEINKASPDKKEQLQTAKDKIQEEIDKNYQSLVRIQNAIKDLSEDRIRSEIARHAASLAGSKYVSGGSEMGKVDCRGIVFYSFNKAGVNLPNNTAAGYHNMMTPIEKSELRPADIITYRSTTPNERGEYITHVQVYIGDAIDKWGNEVHDAVVNASPENGIYIVSLEMFNSWTNVNDHLTPNYGTLLK